MKAIIKEFLVAMAYLRLRAKARKKRPESAPIPNEISVGGSFSVEVVHWTRLVPTEDLAPWMKLKGLCGGLSGKER